MRAIVLARDGYVCWICLHDNDHGLGRENAAIDPRLPWRHPMSATVDHVTPVSRGGALLDPLNGRPAHRVCNQRKGNRTSKLKTSEAW
ncbi:MAG: hypothetical protein QOD92_3646 [Acidimicrobiaceae bacterium]